MIIIFYLCFNFLCLICFLLIFFVLICPDSIFFISQKKKKKNCSSNLKIQKNIIVYIKRKICVRLVKDHHIIVPQVK